MKATSIEEVKSPKKSSIIYKDYAITMLGLEESQQVDSTHAKGQCVRFVQFNLLKVKVSAC